MLHPRPAASWAQATAGIGNRWGIGQSPSAPPAPLAPPPLTSLSENLCFWELDTQAEMGSAVDGQNEKLSPIGKVSIIELARNEHWFLLRVK